MIHLQYLVYYKLLLPQQSSGYMALLLALCSRCSFKIVELQLRVTFKASSMLSLFKVYRLRGTERGHMSNLFNENFRT